MGQFATRRKALHVSKPWVAQCGILASTPVVIRNTAHHRRRSASLATGSESVPGSGRRVQLERRSGKLASRLGLRVQSLAILLVVVVPGLMALVFVHLFLPKLENGIPFKGSFGLRNQYSMLTIDRQRRYCIATTHVGVLRKPTKENPGHCGFTTEEVAKPLEGQ